ncbi:betaine-aldehyde dehydrogenase [Actinopolyspora biskrensis]|uniref:Betaine-aldehyde dehydrogenase n=1 Tax=Actinopolyspora biskrensis TaxID=1470178 RepID=A0A852Z1F2_9ACTN|nr:aldehyde dehydrogenase family protein [Actinopolyspora biskrensis]NYH77476.1 betaine-aldehyde dehydrogenase [Actinopolyspora biskrensis]
MDRHPNFINGRWSPTATDSYSPLIDPCTGDQFAEAARSGSADIDGAFAAAAAAFPTWAAYSPWERQRVLLAVADRVEGNAGRLAGIESANTGKPRETTRVEEIGVAVDVFRFFAGAIRSALAPAAGEYMADHTSYVRREPIGVCAHMVPFNYPLLMAVWKLAPALAAGNTVVLKPSRNTPLSVLAFADLTADLLPPGTVNVVCGDRHATADITRHRTAQHVSATAATDSGLAIATSALTSVKRLHLGLGGKSPAIVFGDADVPRAARHIAHAAYFNGGQDCTAATRILVDSTAHDDFIAELTNQATSLVTTGPDDDVAAFYGPLNNQNQIDRIGRALDALPDHAEVTTGGKPLNRPGFFHPPTIVTNVTNEDAIVRDELFGPVVTVERFSADQDVISTANAADYGLAASVHTRVHRTAMRASSELDYGCVWVNTHLPLPAEMPHGGFKQSGFGKDLSLYGLDEYTRIKHVMHLV